ncbi:hypothetical protein B0I08_103408 [Glaciihabitans tibetensis]|uniref:Uncharacterized protein n=1 Tax=Glaciihabitans tibetensis TaxID=1266600 RepID=A0A2T0VG72_9MICO|nr:hypothetical protein [Glaciihabitans tibetensis]PRY69200.1 hypothetical protein B0I08_103408 [Glaciihabitans tibetensis]
MSNSQKPSDVYGSGIEPELNTVRIFQSHNAAGVPEVAQFVTVIHHRTANTLGSDAMEFLRPLNPSQTKDAGVFLYNDPARGRGWFRLERFSPWDAERIQELVRMEEIIRVVGREPLRPADLAFGNAMVMRTNNPWIMFGIAAVGTLCGLGILSSILAASNLVELIALVAVGVLLILASIAAAVVGAIRLPWWRRARHHAREQGGTMPPDLTGL